MNDLPEAEAEAILGKQYFCEDPTDWIENNRPLSTWTLEQGLLDGDGFSVGLFVRLCVKQSARTRTTAYNFGVFKRKNRRVDTPRVYALDVPLTATDPQDWHASAHEHIGDRRHEVNSGRPFANFEATLDYFCSRANITFTPPLGNPLTFTLK